MSHYGCRAYPPSAATYQKVPKHRIRRIIAVHCDTLKSGTSLQLLLLRDLVTKMSGIEPLEDVSRDQLEAQAGGETLKTSVTDVLGIAKNTALVDAVA